MKPLLSIDAVATLLGVSREFVAKEIKRQRLPAVEIGGGEFRAGRVLVEEDVLDAYIAKGRTCQAPNA